MCGLGRLYAAGCGKYTAKSAALVAAVLLLALVGIGVVGLLVVGSCQRFTDPALGEFVLAHEALGIDSQEYVEAVSCPFGHLSWRDAAVEPRGQARVPQVVRPPRER